jgi:hypothetical protein
VFPDRPRQWVPQCRLAGTDHRKPVSIFRRRHLGRMSRSRLQFLPMPALRQSGRAYGAAERGHPIQRSRIPELGRRCFTVAKSSMVVDIRYAPSLLISPLLHHSQPFKDTPLRHSNSHMVGHPETGTWPLSSGCRLAGTRFDHPNSPAK